MATNIGQLIENLTKLEKSAKKQSDKEKKARKKEGERHQELYTKVQKKQQKASAKVRKGTKLGNKLAMLATLTGFGAPIAALAMAAGHYAGGKKGLKKAQEMLDNDEFLKGMMKTKFSTPTDTFRQELGSDLGMQALVSGLTTFAAGKASELAMGAGGSSGSILDTIAKKGPVPSSVSKGVSGAAKKAFAREAAGGGKYSFGRLLDKLATSPNKVVSDLAGKVGYGQGQWAPGKFLSKAFQAPQEILKATPKDYKGSKIQKWLTGGGKEGHLPLGTKPLEHMGAQVIKNLLTTGATQQKLLKQKDPFAFNMSPQYARPQYSQFEGYRA